MNKCPLFLFFVLFFVSSSCFSKNEEKTSFAPDQQALSLTIYPEGLGLVQDIRNITFQAGSNGLSVYDLATFLEPESLLVRFLGHPPLTLIEQQFQTSILTTQNLLQRSLGQMVKVIQKNTITGEEKTKPARLLGIQNGFALVDFGEQVELQPEHHIAFEKIPSRLSLKPFLKLRMLSPEAQNNQLELTYLTQGLSWIAYYTVDIFPLEKWMHMTGWIALSNQTGTLFRHATIRLATPVQGGVSSPHSPFYQDFPLQEADIYTIPFPVTLHSGAHKNVLFLTAEKIPLMPHYRIYLPDNIHTNREGAESFLPVQTWASIANTKENGLGLSLPKGTIKIYTHNAKGNRFYAGKISHHHTPKTDPLSIPLGTAQHVRCKIQQTDFRQMGEKLLESAFRVDFENPTAQEVSITVFQKTMGHWVLLQKSHEYKDIKPDHIKWEFVIPKKQTLSFRYRFRLSQP